MVTKSDLIEAIRELSSASFEHGRNNTSLSGARETKAVVDLLNKLDEFEQNLLNKERKQ